MAKEFHNFCCNVDRYLKNLSIFFNKVQSDFACRDLLAFPQLNLQEERLPIFFRVVNAADPVGIPKQNISETCRAVKELVAFGNQLGALKAHHLGMSTARISLSQPLLKAKHFRLVLPMLCWLLTCCLIGRIPRCHIFHCAPGWVGQFWRLAG